MIIIYTKKKCRVYLSPFDVRLPKLGTNEDDKIYSVVQPDLFILCDPTKIDDKGCLGAPDLIVEIISASTAKKDLTDKYDLYESSGVKEYWVVFPKEEFVLVYLLDQNGVYQVVDNYTLGEKIQVNIFPELIIDTKDIFEN